MVVLHPWTLEQIVGGPEAAQRFLAMQAQKPEDRDPRWTAWLRMCEDDIFLYTTMPGAAAGAEVDGS